MDMTNQEYGRYVSQKAKPSPLWKNLLWAFVTGGLICTGGQALLNLFRGCGLNENTAGTAVSVTIIFLAAIIIWFLQSFDWRLNAVQSSADSILASIGSFVAPLFTPLGFGDWRASTA